MTPRGRVGEAVGVQVPASSANLGPGFDALAVALDLRLQVWTTDLGSRRVEAEGPQAAELPDDDTNLIWRALLAYCAWAGVEIPRIGLRTRTQIPLERGLGSSAAAAAAGVALGRAVTGGGGRAVDLVRLVAELEGHPDNAAAAVLGGLVVCWDGRVRRLQPTPHLRPVLCTPASRQATRQARAVLPATVGLAEAAGNAGRAALVLAGLAGAMAWEPTAMRDVTHEPARMQLMPASGNLLTALREEGIGACLSGAGPAVLAVVADRDDAAVERVRALATDDFAVAPVGWDYSGAALCPAGAASASG